MYLLVLYFCFTSFLLSILFNRCIGIVGNYLFILSNLTISSILSYYIFFEVCLKQAVCVVTLSTWLNMELLVVPWSFLFDPLSAVMLVVVSTVSLSAHVYSIGYLHNDPHLTRFMSYLSLFTFFMLILVCAANFVVLFLGWEGIGICSYLLINFWYSRLQANKAAIKAIVINKIGDIFLLLAIAILFGITADVTFVGAYAGTYMLATADVYIFLHAISALDLFCLFCLGAAMGKSAQIGLHIWLPDAMEGPTPVSSLIHAATLVTAGIFLLLRSSVLFEYTSNIAVVVLIIGSVTAFFAATTGLFQNDLKKIIAYSTCSQIGYMFFICGYSGYQISMFHLYNHAFFKALLFLTAGGIIHALVNEQDIRRFGGLLKVLPLSYILFFIGSFSLMGFPFLTGFYSKDLLLEVAFHGYNNYHIFKAFSFLLLHLFFWLITHAIVFTCLYSMRILANTFLTFFNGYKYVVYTIHDISVLLSLPLILLSVFSIFIGFFSKDMFVGFGSDFWQNSMAVHLNITYEFNAFFSKSIPLLISFYSISVGIFLFNCNYIYTLLFKITLYFHAVSSSSMFLSKRWYFDKLYVLYSCFYVLTISSEHFFKVFDKGILELFGPFGLVRLLNSIIRKIVTLETHLVYHYSGMLLNNLLLLLLFCLINVY